MELRITGRHSKVTPTLRAYAEEKLISVARFDGRTRLIEVILDHEQQNTTVEAKAHVGRGAPLVVHSRHATAEGAVDLIHDKLERAIRKKKERVRDLNRLGSGGTAAAAGAPGVPPTGEEE